MLVAEDDEWYEDPRKGCDFVIGIGECAVPGAPQITLNSERGKTLRINNCPK